MQIEGALGIDTFVDAEEPPVLFRDKGVSTVRAHETDWRGNNLPCNERLATDLTLVLSVPAIIIVESGEERHRGDRPYPQGWIYRYAALRA